MMRSCILRSLCFLISIYFPSKAAWNNQIFVSPRGNDSQSCGNRARPCRSLDAAFAIVLAGTDGANSTLISAAKGNYTLTKSFNFTNVDTFALVGEGSRSDEVRIICEPSVSLSFVLCQNIALEGFMLQKCGGWRESTVEINKSSHAGHRHQGVKFKTALDFRYCRNARFTKIDISSSPGLGVNFFNVGGVVNFTDCVLADNKALVSNKSSIGSFKGFIEEGYVYSGGGIYMTLNRYGDNVVNVTPSQHDSFQHNNTYIFRNCYFLRNEAIAWNISHKHDIFEDPGPSQFSLGGGLAINFQGNASNCNTEIESCVFLGNRAIWGGGLQVEAKDEVKNNHFAIKNTSFHDNTGVLAGGGVRMGNLLRRGSDDPMNTFTFDNNCAFVNNSAIWGGGISLYATSVLCRENCAKHKTQFIFNRCTWFDNNGTVGAALAAMLANQNDVQIGPEMPYTIRFKDCSFSRNQVVKLDEGVTIGEGALFSDQVPLIFLGNTLFKKNTNTALSLDGSTIELFNQVEFISNKGYKGGAVAMRGLSKITFQKNSKLLFYNNSCELKGGALYIHTVGSPLVDFNATGVDTHECFFGYTDDKADFKNWKTSVIFQGNRAVDDGKGNSVYSTTLRNCRRPGESRQNNTVLRWDFIHFKTLDGNVTSRESEVATDAINMIYEAGDWEVAPGEDFDATVKLIDEIGNSVIGIVDVDINSHVSSSPVKLDTTSSLFLTDGHISHLKLAGKPGSLFTVTLRYVGRQVLVDTIPNILLQHCHEGFFYDGSNCVCTDSRDKGVARCNSDGKTIYLKQGYWAGKVDGKFVTSPCPAEYCNFTKPIFPEVYQYVPGEVCKDNRDQTSILCGECKQGYSVLFGNENCSSNCSDKFLGWIPLYLFALLILTVLVLLFNPNLSSGHLNACLYSYQIVKILTPEGFNYDPFIEFLAALSNLQIHVGVGICLKARLNNADKLIVMICVVFVEVLILITLTKCERVQSILKKFLKSIYKKLKHSQCCPCPGTIRRCGKAFKRNVKDGFAYAYCTIFVLCYVDVAHVSLQLLHRVEVGGKKVLFVDGNMEWFNGLHRAYGSIAIVLMVFVICFPFILAFYTDSNPHLKALRACYKTGRRRRYFLAYYLGCRVVLLLISTYVPAGPLKSALLQFFCILFLFIIAVSRPYKEEANQGADQEAEAQRVANQGGNEPQDAQREADQGGSGEAQREANQDVRSNEEEEVAGETAKYPWINESDVVILTTLGAIAVLSSPISSDVSKSTGYGLMWFVRILAYVPLVMAVLPYAIAWRNRRVNRVPEGTRRTRTNVPDPRQQSERTPPLGQHGVPNEPHVDSDERTPLLAGAQQGAPNEQDPQLNQRIPLADVHNYETTFHTRKTR
ncbi:uncharacterized protein LOC144653433 [Oculina patagonica]